MSIRDWRVAVLSFPTCDVLPAVILHMRWQELLAVGDCQEDPPRLSDHPIRRVLEHRCQRGRKFFILGMLMACELELDGLAGKASPNYLTVNEQIMLAIVIAHVPLRGLAGLPFHATHAGHFLEHCLELLRTFFF